MPHSRRQFLKASAALAAPYVLPGRARASEMPDPVAYFEDLGYERLPAHGLIAEYDFNEGLRYDELPTVTTDQRTIRLQGCARVEDIPRKGEPGVLPYFQILAYRNAQPAYPGEVSAQVLDYLINGVGLDPHRLVVVSTDRIERLRPVLVEFGIGPDQLVLREWEAAKAAGDGSGYFAPPGHPYAPDMPTASLHYPLPDTVPGGELTYPLEDYLEIAEVTVPPMEGETDRVEEGGLGVERVAMAHGDVDAIDTYEEALEYLVAALEEEAQANGVPLPDGYYTFKSL